MHVSRLEQAQGIALDLPSRNLGHGIVPAWFWACPRKEVDVDIWSEMSSSLCASQGELRFVSVVLGLRFELMEETRVIG